VSSSFGSGIESGLVIRLDDDGRPLWIETIDEDRDAASWAVLETDQGFAVVGFEGDRDDDADCTLTSLGRTGEQLWARTYGTASRERCWSLTSLTGGGFALGGEVVTDEGVNDCLLIRVDDAGRQLWRRTYDRGLQERCFAIAPLPNGGMLLAGQTSSDGGDERDVYLVGTDADGEVRYEHVLGEAGIDLAHGAVAIADGVIVVGYSATFGVDDVDPLLIKVTRDGEIAWTRPLEVPGHARGLSIDAGPDGGLCIGGFRRTEAGGTVPIIIRATAEGRTLWRRDLEGFSIGYTAIADRDGGCVITGHTSTGEGGGLDLFVARLTPDGRQAPEASTHSIRGDDDRTSAVQGVAVGFAVSAGVASHRVDAERRHDPVNG